MFKKQPKSKHPIGFMADTVFDLFLPKPKKSHKKAFIGLGLFSVACVAVARALDKQP
jgi:hypothetical protein